MSDVETGRIVCTGKAGRQASNQQGPSRLEGRTFAFPYRHLIPRKGHHLTDMCRRTFASTAKFHTAVYHSSILVGTRQGTKVCRYNWHSAGSLRWPFPMLKYKNIFRIKYMEAILSNSTRKLLRFETIRLKLCGRLS